jgi:hypothetical protein
MQEQALKIASHITHNPKVGGSNPPAALNHAWRGRLTVNQNARVSCDHDSFGEASSPAQIAMKMLHLT